MIRFRFTVMTPALALALAFGAAACGAEEVAQDPPTEAVQATPETEAPTGPPMAAFTGSVLGSSTLPPLPEGEGPWQETERDWAIAQGTVEWARAQALGALPLGELAATLAATFVGTPYEPGTLELPGEERLVVNLHTFDCVTLVEHALVLARLVAAPEVEPAEDEAFRDAYREALTEIRYRDGVLDGYTSRLHYFTEWLDHGIEAGRLEDVTPGLGGIVDDRPIDFMTNHTEAYRQLDENPALVEEIAEVEARLSAGTRYYIPQESIHEVEEGIRTGDIIAAVSTIDGLDIAHTGFAFRMGERIHLLHAPLVGDSVEISPLPLADRIQGIAGQKGIRVVRPLH